MIVVKLIGGLGNQMFQYAFGLSLAKKNNTELKLDMTSYDTNPHRVFELDKLSITAKPAKKYELRQFHDRTGAMAKFKYFAKRHLKNEPQLIIEDGFSFDMGSLYSPSGKKVGTYNPKIINKRVGKFTYVVGFWQKWGYVEPVADELKKEFAFKDPAVGKNKELLKKITSTNSVSLHIRRGDYVSDANAAKTLGMPTQEYYKKAVEIISEKVKDPVLFIISDDPEWCKKNLKYPLKMVIVDVNPPDKGHEDLRLISNCKHNIMANSSFSWWGSWLNQNPDKIVIGPKAWFKEQTFDTEGIFGPDWISL